MAITPLDNAIDALIEVFNRGKRVGYEAAKRDAERVAREFGETRRGAPRLCGQMIADKIKAIRPT